MRLVRLAAATAGASLVLLAGSCGSTTSGDPSPSSNAGQHGSSSANTTPSPSGTAVNSPKDAARTLEHADPCELLSKADLADLEISAPGKADDTVTSRGCRWLGQQVVLLISIRAHQGIDTFRLAKSKGGGTVSGVTINGRQGKQQTDNHGGCTVAVPVTDTARVDIGVTLDDHSKSCAGAQQVARLVEPHLPSVK